MKELVIYVHGKNGSAEEAQHYKALFLNSEVIGFDYQAINPWDAVKEFTEFYDKHAIGFDSVTLIANSIGAYFALLSLDNRRIDKAFLISPIVDMEALILNMLSWANASEKELEDRKTINTDFGEVLSWDYLCYVRLHPIKWSASTSILYGENDEMTSLETIVEFSNSIAAKLTVMPNGEHWFHTEEQMKFLDEWILAK